MHKRKTGVRRRVEAGLIPDLHAGDRVVHKAFGPGEIKKLTQKVALLSEKNEELRNGKN